MSWAAVEGACSPSGLTAVLTPRAWARADDVGAAVRQQAATSARSVVVDLQHTPTVGWDLFDVLLEAHDVLCRRGKRLLLVNVLPGAAFALTLLDTGRQLTVVTLERVLSEAWTEARALDLTTPDEP